MGSQAATQTRAPRAAPHTVMDQNPEPVLRVQGLRKSFASHLSLGRSEILKGIDFEVRRGEIYGLLGPNGAGKTTTIKSILGLLRPDAGSIILFGLPAREPAARRKVGFLPENPYFYDYLTASEFLDFSAKLIGLSAAVRGGTIPALLARVGLARAPAIPLRKFSKGMVQRVGLAQALLGDPDFVVLDEPMSGLDPVGRREFRDIILSLRAAGRTVFFSSHILQDAEMICDRVGILKGGRLVREGDLATLLDPGVPAFEVTLAGCAAPAGLGLRTLSVRGEEILVRVEGEGGLDRVLKHVFASGGRLVSVAPIRRTLEEIFLREIQGPDEAPGARPGAPVAFPRGGERP